MSCQFSGMERRQTPRREFNTTVTIRFLDETKVVATGEINNISAGGIQFSIPVEVSLLETGDLVSFTYELPVIGKILTNALIRYHAPCEGKNGRSVKTFGAKFIDLKMDLWQYLLEFCANTAIPPENFAYTGKYTEPVISNDKRKHYRVHTHICGNLALENNSTIPCTILDASFGGVKMNVQGDLNPYIKASLYFEFQLKEYNLSGKVTWVQKTEHGLLCGLSFSGLPPTQFEGLRRLVLHLSGTEINNSK